MSKDSWSTTVDGIKLIINGGINASYGKMIAGSLIVPIKDKIAKTGYLKVTQIEVTLELKQKPLNKSEQASLSEGKDSWSTTVDGIKLIINGGINGAYGKMIAGSLVVPIKDKIAKTGYLKVTQIEVTLEQQKPLNKSEQLIEDCEVAIGEAEDPEHYHQQYGKCPPGYRREKDKCVVRKSLPNLKDAQKELDNLHQDNPHHKDLHQAKKDWTSAAGKAHLGGTHLDAEKSAMKKYDDKLKDFDKHVADTPHLKKAHKYYQDAYHTRSGGAGYHPLQTAAKA